MSVLRAIESKIEGLLEGIFGRAFRTHVQPVELARKLAKEMDEHRSVSVSRVYVPNEYTVYLSPADRQQFASYEGSLVGELQEYLTEHAKREAYALLTPPRVSMATDPDLAIGEFGIATRRAAGRRAPAAPRIESSNWPRRASILALPAPSLLVLPEACAGVGLSRSCLSRALRSRARGHHGLPPLERAAGTEVVTLTIDGGLPGDVGPGRAGPLARGDIRVADGNVSRRHAG
jgi:hypothetical protein